MPGEGRDERRVAFDDAPQLESFRFFPHPPQTTCTRIRPRPRRRVLGERVRTGRRRWRHLPLHRRQQWHPVPARVRGERLPHAERNRPGHRLHGERSGRQSERVLVRRGRRGRPRRIPSFEAGVFETGVHEAGPPVAPEAGAPACSDAGAGGTCLIDCGGPTLCPTTTACAPGEPCAVTCDHTSACQDTQVLCNGATSCNITCSETSTCQGATIFCGDAGCNIMCSGTSSCEGMTVVCGSGPCLVACPAGGGGDVTQFCGSASACNNACK